MQKSLSFQGLALVLLFGLNRVHGLTCLPSCSLKGATSTKGSLACSTQLSLIPALRLKTIHKAVQRVSRLQNCAQAVSDEKAEAGAHSSTDAPSRIKDEQPAKTAEHSLAAQALTAPEATTLELLEWPRLSRQVAAFASTRQGRAAIGAGLAVPADQAESETLQQETAEAHFIEQQLNRPIELRGFGDIAPLVSLAGKGGVLTGSELSTVCESLATAATLIRSFRDIQAEETQDTQRLQLLPALFDGIPEQAELRRAIKDAVDESGSVRDTAAASLGELRFAIRELSAATKRELTALMQRKGDALASRTITRRDSRFVIQVPAKQRHLVPGVVRDVSSTGLTLYVEPKQVEAANTKLRQLAKREEAIINAVLKALSQRVGAPKVSSEMQQLDAAVVRVDLATARARYSAKMRATPVVFGSLRHEGLRLDQMFHPMLVWKGDGAAPNISNVVPQDYVMDVSKRVAVITGPNTGGKTVALKTLGLAALMARAGLWVVSGAGRRGDSTSAPTPIRMPYFDKVMADIGDDQSIVQSLSTFSAHVARVQAILQQVTRNSLVLLDEVGAGTDPTEGSALGTAVLRRLAATAALAVCTTHHGSLKTLKYSDPRFENACVEFDDVALAPTYRLLWGIPGRSNAIAIARRLGMQREVVDDADALLNDGELEVGQVVAAMQEEQEEQRALSAELSALRDEAAATRDAMAAQAKEQARAEQQLMAQQRAALEAELEAAKAQIRALLDEARSGNADGSAQKQASLSQQKLSRIGKQAFQTVEADQQGAPERKVEASLDDISVGDLVLVARLGDSPVKVDEVQKKQLVVTFGGFRMNVKISEVLEVTKPKAPPQPASSPKKAKVANKRERTAVRLASNSLDLRGMRVAEVGDKLVQAVDRALEMGTLYVIHGRGTGSMRKYVREVLAEEPMVERFEDAPESEGGNGCTIAYLR
mmetsp:Transcript_9579/g.18740  ORF Transcript_9579/g.18740 Transcript_9579/m.18740 type:complete len:940 (-) Transcript_9579:175-2994(-)